MRTAYALSFAIHLVVAGTAFVLASGDEAPPRPRAALALAVHADVPAPERPLAAPAPPDAPPPVRATWPVEDPVEEEPAYATLEAVDAPLAPPRLPVRVRLARSRPSPAPAPPPLVAPEPPAPPAGVLVEPRARADLCPRPRYPLRARRLGLEGEVVLLLDVDPRGEVARVEVRTSSGHAELDDAAVAAVRQWRFEPARRDGRPVAHAVELPVRFRLR